MASVDAGLAWPLMGVLVASFGLSIGLGIIIPLLPLYARELGLSISSVGLLVASFSFARVALDLAGRVIFGRISERVAATVGAATVAVGSLMTASADGFALLLVARIVHGAGVALFLAAGLVYIGREVPASSRARAISLHQGALLLGGNLGPVVGGVMGTLIGLRAPFYVAAAFGILAIPLSWRVFPRSPASELDGSARRLAVDRRLRWTLGVALLVTAISWGIRSSVRFTVVPLYVVEDLGSTAAFSGMLLSLMFLGDVFGLAVGSRAMDAYGRRWTLAGGFVATGLVIGVIGVTSVTWALIPLALAYGLANGFMAVVPITIAADVNGRDASTMTTTRVATDLGLLVGPWTGGVVLEMSGFAPSFGWHASACLLTAALALSVRETRGLSGDGSYEPPSVDGAQPSP